MAWQFKTRRDVADVSLLSWIQEQMHSLSDLEILGGKFVTLGSEGEMMALSFWNPDYSDIQLPGVPQGKWTCHLIADGTLEEVLHEAVNRLDALEKQSHESAFHSRLVVTPGKGQFGRVALYSPPADAKLFRKKPNETIEASISELVAEQRQIRTMFKRLSGQVESLAAQIEKR